MEEIWKNMIDNKKYEVSNKGNIRHVNGKNLKIQYSKDGYSTVVIYDNNNKAKSIRVHREVLKAFNFIDNYKQMEVNHKNFNRTDNRLENLEWTTSEENSKHRNSHLEYYNSEECYDSFGNKFKSYREAARYYGISPNTVKRDVLGQTKRVCKGRVTFLKKQKRL